MPYWADRATAALARELNSLRKDIAVLILLARSVLEDLVMRHINTTIYVSMSSIIPTPLIPYYTEKLEVIFCVRGVISPLLANLYLNRFLKYWRLSRMGEKLEAVVVTYADDFVILSRQRAREALAWTRQVLSRLGLALNQAKTCIRRARRGAV